MCQYCYFIVFQLSDWKALLYLVWRDLMITATLTKENISVPGFWFQRLSPLSSWWKMCWREWKLGASDRELKHGVSDWELHPDPQAAWETGPGQSFQTLTPTLMSYFLPHSHTYSNKVIPPKPCNSFKQFHSLMATHSNIWADGCRAFFFKPTHPSILPKSFISSVDKKVCHFYVTKVDGS